MQVTRVPGGEAGDVVAVEEPLEIRLGDTPVASNASCPARNRSGRLETSEAGTVSPLSTLAASMATASSAPLPQTPQDEDV